jgi:hypothetical protein
VSADSCGELVTYLVCAEMYEYIMYTMVSLCSNLLLTGESTHGPSTFYSKMTVSYIMPTHRNDEMQLLLTFSELRNCICSIPQTASDPTFVTTHKI